jgi:hypothetical protein
MAQMVVFICFIAMAVCLMGWLFHAANVSMIGIRRSVEAADSITQSIDNAIALLNGGKLEDIQFSDGEATEKDFQKRFLAQQEIQREKWRAHDGQRIFLCQVIASKKDDGGNIKYISAIKVYDSSAKLMGWFETHPMNESEIVNEFNNIKLKNDAGKIRWDYLSGEKKETA